MFITSPLKYMDEIFELLPNLLVDQILLERMNTNIQILDQRSKVYVWDE